MPSSGSEPFREMLPAHVPGDGPHPLPPHVQPSAQSVVSTDNSDAVHVDASSVSNIPLHVSPHGPSGLLTHSNKGSVLQHSNLPAENNDATAQAATANRGTDGDPTVSSQPSLVTRPRATLPLPINRRKVEVQKISCTATQTIGFSF